MGVTIMADLATRVAVVAQQALAREGIRRILVDGGFCVRAASAELDPEVLWSDAPDLIVVDSASSEEGIEVVSILRAAMPATRLVLITPECDLMSVSRAFAAGADGCLTNSIACEALIGTLKLVLMGEKVLPTQAVSELVNDGFRSKPILWAATLTDASLSQRENEILSQLVLGDANKVISRHLLISEATVKVHVKAILRKLKVDNRTQAAIWAVKRGIIGDASRVASLS